MDGLLRRRWGFWSGFWNVFSSVFWEIFSSVFWGIFSSVSHPIIKFKNSRSAGETSTGGASPTGTITMVTRRKKEEKKRGGATTTDPPRTSKNRRSSPETITSRVPNNYKENPNKYKPSPVPPTDHAPCAPSIAPPPPHPPRNTNHVTNITPPIINLSYFLLLFLL